MRHLIILIEKKNEEVVVLFDEPLVIENETMTVKCASVFWNYDNITTSTHITYGTKKVWFKPGYWTANMIIEKLKEVNAKAELVHYSQKIKITPSENLALLGLAPLLGFTESQHRITKGKSVISDLPVNVNLGLKYFEIKCNAVNTTSTSFQGQRSNAIAILPITTTQSLKGTVTHYDNINGEIMLNNGIYNELKFSTSHKIGDILLEVLIK